MRITELFTAQSIALDEALTDQEQIISRLVELQATHGNITDKDAYKKALYAREAEGSTYVDNGITVPHAKTNVVTRPSLAALRLSSPVQYNAEDDGTTDLLFAIAAPENGSLHVDMLARMMQMLMNEDFVEKLKAAKTPAEFLDCIDAQEEAQFGAESFTQQEIPQNLGKTRRAVLKERIASGEVTLVPAQKPDGAQLAALKDESLRALTQELCGVIREVTGAETVAPDTHVLHDLGVDSMTYYAIFSAVSEHCGVALAMDAARPLFTPRDFAAEVLRERSAQA